MPVVHSHPEIMSGTPVFVGTRVPVQALLDYLEEGDTIDSFLDAFPSVTREQAVAFLEQAAHMFLANAPRRMTDPGVARRRVLLDETCRDNLPASCPSTM
jgi:uncharacterized protein (DUF433 family)